MHAFDQVDLFFLPSKHLLLFLFSHLTSRASTQGHHLHSTCLQHWGARDPWTPGVHQVTPQLPSFTSCHRTNSPTPSCCTITSLRTDRYAEVLWSHHSSLLFFRYSTRKNWSLKIVSSMMKQLGTRKCRDLCVPELVLKSILSGLVTCEIGSLGPRSVVVWAACCSVLLAVYPRPRWKAACWADVFCVSGSTFLFGGTV